MTRMTLGQVGKGGWGGGSWKKKQARRDIDVAVK